MGNLKIQRFCGKAFKLKYAQECGIKGRWQGKVSGREPIYFAISGHITVNNDAILVRMCQVIFPRNLHVTSWNGTDCAEKLLPQQIYDNAFFPEFEEKRAVYYGGEKCVRPSASWLPLF